MKKILFRGFHPDVDGLTTIIINGCKIKGEWYYWELLKMGYYWYDLVGAKIFRPYGDICKKKLIPETVGQWVMEDKDGKDIFSGDIIGVHQFLFDGSEHENELVGRVVWDKEKVCWAVDHIDHKQIQKYMAYEDDVEFEKVKVALCELYGLHEESYSKIGNSWEVEQ